MIRTALLTALSLAACIGSAVAQQSADSQEQIVDLGHGMYCLSAPHAGNTTVAIGTDGILVVDTQFPQNYRELRARIAGLSRLPVKYAIDTHFHGDHTGGNESFHKDGAILVAHENVARRLRHPPPDSNGRPGVPAPEGAIPTLTYSGAGTIVKIGGVQARLLHPAPAHTDGDTVVIFPAVNVLSTGDIVGSKNYPNIDLASGGSIDGMIAGAGFIIAHADAKTIIVPGHGPVTDKAGVIAYRKMLMTARDRIARAKAAGKTEKQVADAHLLADLDVRWGGDPGTIYATRFPLQVYRSVP